MTRRHCVYQVPPCRESQDTRFNNKKIVEELNHSVFIKWDKRIKKIHADIFDNFKQENWRLWQLTINTQY